jgi:hypothetical protein
LLNPKVRVSVKQAGINRQPGPINDARVGRYLDVLANIGYQTIAKYNRAFFDYFSSARHYARVRYGICARGFRERSPRLHKQGRQQTDCRPLPPDPSFDHDLASLRYEPAGIMVSPWQRHRRPLGTG